MSNQSARQASVRAITGTEYTYNGDWMALFDQSGIPAGEFNGRFLAWLNTKIPEPKTNLPDAMASYAINVAGVSCWNEVGDIGGLPPPTPGPLDFVSSDSGASLNVTFDLAAPIAALGVIVAFEGTLTNITADHGGEALNLVRLDINASEKTATAMFIGNGLTIASDTLTITLVGGAVGKAWVGRINDDYGYTNIASGWNAGGFGTAAQSPTYTVSGVDGTGRSLSVWGGTNPQGRAGFVMPLANNTTQFSAKVVGGDKVAVTGWTTTTGWSESGGVYTHTGANSGISKVLSPTVAGPIGFDADVTLASGASMTVIMVPVVGTPTQRVIYGPYNGKWAEATEDTATFQSLAIMATGDTTITSINYITSPRFLQGVISRSNGTVSNGTNITWGSVNVDDYVNTNIEVHQAASPIPLPDLQLWLDAADTSTITQVSGFVSQWNDKSGLGNHATQSTGSSQPVTNTRTINGKNALDFDGTDDFMSLPSGLYSIALGSNTIFVMFQSDNAGMSTQRVAWGQVAGFLRYGSYFTATSYRSIHATSASPIDIAMVRDTLPHIGGFSRNGTSILPYLNGVAGVAGSNGADLVLTSMGVGGDVAGTQALDGLIGEIIIYSRELTIAEKNQIGSYLSAKWGAVWTGL